MKLALAQLNSIVGDVTGNCRRLIEAATVWHHQADLIIFPELYLAGYPPRDLLGEPWFLDRVEQGIASVLQASSSLPEIGILFGAPVRTQRPTGLGLYNAALLIQGGQILCTRQKSLLPTYDVFDEARYFDEAATISTVAFKNEVLGISICEDAWNDPELWQKRMYPFDPVGELVNQGATLLLNISASPFTLGKETTRYELVQNHAQRLGKPFILVNQIGGNDELIFDGRSMVFDGNGHLTGLLPAFREEIRLVDTSEPAPAVPFREQERSEAVYEALVLGIGDYFRKCGFTRAIIGLSGGIDSALVAALAAAAIGGENVIGIAMPSMFSADESTELAERLAGNLGMAFHVIPITSTYESYKDTLCAPLGFTPGEINVTLENIQARIRGNILMAFSNKFGALVLSTGNKSELATGYCTLYGDMAGGLAAISDVPKTMVYDLARYINREREIIPERIITRPPTAELRPNQTDQDTLPPYEILDRILEEYIENRRSKEEIIKLGFEPAIVSWVLKTVNRSEYKRRQAAPGLKVTTRAFGIGRRMPIAAKYEA